MIGLCTICRVRMGRYERRGPCGDEFVCLPCDVNLLEWWIF